MELDRLGIDQDGGHSPPYEVRYVRGDYGGLPALLRSRWQVFLYGSDVGWAVPTNLFDFV